ncbi:MAG: CRISPR-associated endonuclease Cas2 [Solirubrobacterales bacterium]
MSEAIRRMVVAYDIADNNRRDRVAVALQEFGERVQFSVFMVDGRPATFVRLRAVLNALILPEADNIMRSRAAGLRSEKSRPAPR